ncbi:MAG: glycosyltransferase [Acidobacteriota bacterium]|nr:MAG: glycosyltransferase [Acidobacteriota bacterium]
MRTNTGDGMKNTRCTRRVLMVAYHFAPEVTSATHRAIHFARALHDEGFGVRVLAASLESLRLTDPSLNDVFPHPECIMRVGAARRIGDLYLSVKSRLSRSSREAAVEQEVAADGAGSASRGRRFAASVRAPFAAWDLFPDAQKAWFRPALRASMGAGGDADFDLVYASAPPWTALRVGHAIARRLKRPLVSAFRDPWTQVLGSSGRYRERVLERAARRWERQIVNDSRLVICNSPGLTGQAREAYGGDRDEKFLTVLNGSAVPRRARSDSFPASQQLIIRHLGSLYAGRSVRPLLRALGDLVSRGDLSSQDVRVELIGSRSEADALEGVAGGIEVVSESEVTFEAAVQRMQEPAVLLVVQPPKMQHEIPTKLYDYLCTGNPVLVLASESSHTWAMAREFSRCQRLDWESPDENLQVLGGLLRTWKTGELRQERTQQDTASLTKIAVCRQFVEAIRAALDMQPE